jgi:PKD repeat protein
MKRKSALAVVLTMLVGLVVSAASPPSAFAAPPSFRAAATANSSTSRPSITVPASVQAGDQLVYILTTNVATTATTPSGWTLLATASDGSPDMRSWVFTRTAAANTAGSAVAITLGTSAKASRVLLAYTGAEAPSVVRSSVQGVSGVNLTSPSAPITGAETLVLSYWADKTSANTGWSLPGSVTRRANSVGSGSGRITATAADAVADIGTWPGATATSTAASTKGIAWTIALPPSITAIPPIAALTSSCNLLTCTFDARGSSDPDGSIVEHRWTFGDGNTAMGSTLQHTYASAGAYTVTLTVTDDAGASDSETVVVNPTVPVGAHTAVVPDVVAQNHVRITTGEIFDLEHIGNRVFIAGTFTSVSNAPNNGGQSYAQRFLAAYDVTTGRFDTNFRPTFDRSVTEIEASPDGTRLYAVGRFNTVNGVTKRKVVALNPTNGAVITGFTANANAAATSVEATNTTVYIGGQFTTVNNVSRVGLAAVSATNGAVDTSFVNHLSGGIGVDGLLTVQALKLTPDLGKLLVVHTGRQIAGQDRYGVGLIDTQSEQLLPWRTRLWDDNLQFVGGIQRIYAADISPDGSYFVVTSGSGGDRPPINDTAVAYAIDGGDDMQPLWISRLFDSVYSVAISDVAVYVGGHFNYMESPSAPDPWPGLTNVGYGRGQGLAGYGLGDDIVIREHIGALDPATGKALEWSPESNSFEGNKAMLVMPQGLVTGGDATTQGGFNVGRIAFYGFAAAPPSGANETTITTPIEGRVEEADVEFVVEGVATAASGVQRVQVEVIDRDTRQYLQDDLVSWGGFNAVDAETIASPGATTSAWAQTFTISGNRRLQILARTHAVNGSNDSSKAVKKIETFGLTNPTPNTSITGPIGVVPSTTFIMTGTATDDSGVNAINISLRDSANRYLQDDGSAAAVYNTIRVLPDVIGATSATWSWEVTVPYEDEWSAEAIAVDDAGQADLRGGTRSWIVSSTAVPPTVAITSPAIVNPPTPTAPISMAPGAPVTFSGSATDDAGLKFVEIRLRNTTTRENLASDGTWGVNSVLGWHRISPLDISGASYNWSYTTPFNLVPGNYEFLVQAVDDLNLTTPSSNRGSLVINVSIPGDAAPDGRISPTGTFENLVDLNLNLAGTATDDIGVAGVRVSLRERQTGLFVQPNGTLAGGFATLEATLGTPNGTSTTWSLAVTLPSAGDYDVTAFAYDGSGQQDTSTSGATARYRVFPGDSAPVSNDNLFAPAEGGTFTQSRIITSGRFEDNQQMAAVQVAIRNDAGRYMNSAGGFTSTSESWRPAFMNSPGSPGSNFSYTSPILPEGTYTLFVRGVDQNGLATNPPVQRTVTVTAPAGNLPPVASFTTSCAENVCSFDARSSTDENAATLTYSWTFGQGSASGSGPVPSRTYTASGTYTVTLTARDEYGATGTATATVTIVEPSGNVAPVAVNNPPSCVSLVCNFSAVGSADPNVGDTISYSWDFADGGPGSTSAAPSRTFPAPGTYTVVVTVTDGWGRSSTASREVTVAA